MKLIFYFPFLLLFCLATVACKNTASDSGSENTKSNEVESSPSSDLNDCASFLNEILIGFEFSAIAKHMIHTPFKFLGETNLLSNYETVDVNQVNHMVTFHKNPDDPNVMTALVYNIDFKDSNSHLVNNYQKTLIQQIDDAYGEWSEDFSTGYNDAGNYEAEWIFEAGVMLVTVGINFIQVDLREH